MIVEIGFELFLFLVEGFDALSFTLDVEAGVLGSTSSTAEVVKLGVECFFLLAGFFDISVGVFEVSFGRFELLTLFLDLLIEIGPLLFEVGLVGPRAGRVARSQRQDRVSRFRVGRSRPGERRYQSGA